MWSNWQQFVSFIRTLKGRKREQAAFAFAVLACFPAGYTVGGKLFPNFKDGLDWQEWSQIVLYVVGVVCIFYAVVRVWRLNHPPEMPPAKDRPSAIKGPMAFTEADGELFRKLGRESELQKLLGLALDDQVLMIVVRGASGAGKTSLLRAGLKHILGERAIFHYWEAVPTEPDKGLLRAVQEKWPEGGTKPMSLDELVNPADALGRQEHVIVLDQFEQLRGSKKIFGLLSQIVRKSKPPHRITWVIAFRREFSADWLDFVSPEIERGIRPPQDVSLRLFTAEQAREVIGQLVNESNLKDSIEQSVINNLVEAATVESEVSPVDIGIGLLVLAELHERQSGNTITIRDYQFAGGAEGLLTQYISRCLDLFPKEHQEAILKAMLALRDAETNQRLAEGLTVDELAAESGAETRLLKTQLDRLSHRDTRLLETVTPADGTPVRYRLPHERLIPALYRLTGKLLAEVDQAKLKFQNAFQAWKTNDKRRSYLLKAKELKLVERYETQIPWGSDEQEKKSFLFRSKRLRMVTRVGFTAVVVALIAAGWMASLLYQRYEHKKYLFEVGYPMELYDWQGQLKKIELVKEINLENFGWLSSDSVEEVELHAERSSNSLAGLTSLSRCRNLKKLTLDLRGSQVSDLKPLGQLKGLTQLTLILRDTKVGDLRPLEQLKELTQLTLDLAVSQVRDLKSLEQLKELRQLTLDLEISFVSDLKPLEQLNKLTQLSVLGFGHLSDLKPLERLKQLTELTLFDRGPGPFDLKLPEPLKGLSQLTKLTLEISFGQVSDLKSLEQLKGLKQLTLALNIQENDLKPLEQLQELTQLTLDLRGSRVSDLKALESLKGLKQLTLTLNSQVRSLEPLEQLNGLTQLSLDLSESQVRDLKPLEQLSGPARLTLYLRVSQASDLKSLEQLNRLTQLKLISELSDLKSLEQLKGLTQLVLIVHSEVSDLKPLGQLKELAQLTLDLSGIRLSDLKPLEQLKGVTQLTLILGNEHSPPSEVKDLETLCRLPQLRSLSIEGATTEQRKSLQKIPAGLVELKF